MIFEDKIIKILKKIFSEPALLITLPIALLIYPCILLISPFILFRFGFFHSDRLGHFAVNTEIFFCEEKYFKRINIPTFDFYYFPTKPCNLHLAKMISIKVNIFPKFLIRPFCLISRSFDFLSPHVTGRSSNSDYDTNHVLDKVKLQLGLSRQEIQKGNKVLKKLKLNHKKIICVGVRDNSYLKKKYTKQDFRYHDHRNDKIEKYIPGIKFLLKKGYTVFRMGSITNKKLNIKHKNFLDYSNNKIKSDFMDVYIAYNCKLFISNNTGLDALGVMFRKPILHIGSLPLGAISTFSDRYYNTFSNYFSLKKKRNLKLSEIFDLNLQYLWKKKDFQKNKIRIVHPSKLEILKYFSETISIIESKKRNKKDIILEKKFKVQFSKYIIKKKDGDKNYHNKIKTKVLSSFLNFNKHFLG